MTEREPDANAIDPPENTKTQREPDPPSEDAAAPIDPPENTGGGN
ncbi:MAG TPA: hypothetical protein VGP85_22200 [Pyrinomonadaceae bacterium]|jgi:hypothetical protein|nr:hypothetical protein [Pyrinomonadaceae bacterium]